ncbi:MAG TPA: LPS-assembly protein LptD [Pararhizobium sp.]|nr:LPS-assembly protein LptD [Pararhizobium sp.]
MGGLRHGKSVTLRRILCAGVAACALAAMLSSSTYAQVAGVPSSAQSVPAGSKLLLSADKLIYDDKNHTVVAEGSVRIAYGGYRMVAKRVEYDQDTGRMKASGEVELVNPDGTKLYADNLDVTDDFSDGFVNALRIDTPARTHIVATSAERRGGAETQFNNGVYTACEPCKKHPGKAPFWQVEARKVVHDTNTKTIRLRNARFEMFGVPIAWFPYFSVPDQTVKRKSGFLRPAIGYSKTLGFEASIPYYWVISPYMDATFTGTGYTTQGFLGEVEFRQRFRNGFHTLTLAGIDQASPDTFDAGTVDRDQSFRGLAASRGEFAINPRWTVGWNVMLESDGNFGRTYTIPGYSGSVVTSEAHLTGLSGKNYFDMHAYHFDEQAPDNGNAESYKQLEEKQPFVLPVIDYSRVSDEPVLGGQLSFTANETSLWRDRASIESPRNPDDLLPNVPAVERFRGLSGNDNRLSAELEWKRTLTTSGGLLLTPIFALRGDAFAIDMDAPDNSYPGDFAGSGTHLRTMETAGIEARYPILATTAHSTHVIEPIAQVFVRPNEPLAGGLPNEDAQSFVFDTTNLFERDKFSGFDRVEGGTRANVGLRYTGSFDNGVTLQSVFGQSYQLFGQNSFATPDLVYAGHDSGLDTDVSDYVGSVGMVLPVGLSLDAGARFDKDTFEVQRTDISAGYSNSRLSTHVVYSQLAPQPFYDNSDTQQEVTTRASLRFAQNWRVFGSATYDFENTFQEAGFSRSGIGLGFNNDCFAMDLIFSQERNLIRSSSTFDTTDWAVGATISFRTLGDLRFGSNTLTQ